MDLALLKDTLVHGGEPDFRARQVWAWAARGARGFGEMTDLPAALREKLEREVPFSSLTLRQESLARDGTVKALFATADERPLEAVLMRYRDGRRSLCVSSQSGCPLTCRFCATGAMRFARNLTASEILDQALYFRRFEDASARGGRTAAASPNGTAARARVRGTALSNCVFMGMGEPLLNLDAVLEACERLPDVGISHRHTTISTIGWIPGIERLAEQSLPLRLAVSVHAADEALRSELMPVNDRYPLRDVLDAAREFYARKRRRVFVEYVMLAGVNDRYEQALALARMLGAGAGAEQPRATHGDRAAGAKGAARTRGSIFKVNLIPYNPGGAARTDARAGDEDAGLHGERAFTGSSRESIAAFAAVLRAQGIPATVRLTRGREIDAACGQLAARERHLLEPLTR
jgi:23S rRNA (adenine2503-C2)-methyltransferase